MLSCAKLVIHPFILIDRFIGLFGPVFIPSDLQVVEDHFVSDKNSFYDLTMDVSRRTVILASQDRKLRFYDVVTGKETRSLKGRVPACLLRDFYVISIPHCK